MEKTAKKSWTTRAFLISLAVLVLISLVNWGIISGWGNVRIFRVNLIGDNGMKYSALMYVPQNATNDTPAPAIAMYHGNSGNARNHESWAVEFTRRGFVVISVDNLGGGVAEYSEALGRYAVPDQFTKYVLSLPFVDTSRFVTSGHSLGGDTVVEMTLRYNPAVCRLQTY